MKSSQYIGSMIVGAIVFCSLMGSALGDPGEEVVKQMKHALELPVFRWYESATTTNNDFSILIQPEERRESMTWGPLNLPMGLLHMNCWESILVSAISADVYDIAHIRHRFRPVMGGADSPRYGDYVDQLFFEHGIPYDASRPLVSGVLVYFYHDGHVGIATGEGSNIIHLLSDAGEGVLREESIASVVRRIEESDSWITFVKGAAIHICNRTRVPDRERVCGSLDDMYEFRDNIRTAGWNDAKKRSEKERLIESFPDTLTQLLQTPVSVDDGFWSRNAMGYDGESSSLKAGQLPEWRPKRGAGGK